MPEFNSTINLEEVLIRAKSGDKEAYAMLYKEYSTPLYRFVYSRVNDKTDADDIVQDAFVRAFGAIDRFADQGKGMLPYLMTIARNLIINHAKKKKADTPGNEFIELTEADDRADSFALAGDDRALLAAALSSLSEIEKEVISLRFYAERSYAEIAELLEKREDAIRQHVARALRKMRSHMSDQQTEFNLNEI